MGEPVLKLIRSTRTIVGAARRPLRRFVRDSTGATAVEFAFVALPLMFMLFAILELAMVFMVSATLENATASSARTIRTGALQTAGGATAITFRDAICANLGWLESQCTTNLSVDVRTFGDFSAVTNDDPYKNGVLDKSKLLFAMGEEGQIVLVRSFYQWKLLTPFLNAGLEKAPGGGFAVITAAAAFKNEPYK